MLKILWLWFLWTLCSLWLVSYICTYLAVCNVLYSVSIYHLILAVIL